MSQTAPGTAQKGSIKCTDAPKIKRYKDTCKPIREHQNAPARDPGSASRTLTFRRLDNTREGIENDGDQTRYVESKVTGDVEGE